MKKRFKNFVAVLLVVIMILSSFSVNAFAEGNFQTDLILVDIDGYGEGISFIPITMTSSDGKGIISISDSFGNRPREMVDNIKALFGDPAGDYVDVPMMDEDFNPFSSVLIKVGQFTPAEAIEFGMRWETTPALDSFKPLRFVKMDGSTMLDLDTLDFITKQIVDTSLDGVLANPTQATEIAEDLATAGIEVCYIVVPASEMGNYATKEQLDALNSATDPNNSETLYFVRMIIKVYKDGKEYIVTESAGKKINEVCAVYPEDDPIVNPDDMGFADSGKAHVLHITSDGSTVTKIAETQRCWDSLIFTTSMTGDFFVVYSDEAPTGGPEPEPVDRLPDLHTATLKTEGLSGATATLSKTENIKALEETITLTITPEEGKRFLTKPTVEVKGQKESSIVADVGEFSVDENGVYTCEISNIRTNVKVFVNGETQVPPITDYFDIRTPSRDVIKYKDGIVLHADFKADIPVGAKIEWKPDNDNFKWEPVGDGDELLVTSIANGSTKFTATLYDANGIALEVETVELTSNAGFFAKIAGFFRGLFGLTTIYDE